jgi:hypothetical protein
MNLHEYIKQINQRCHKIVFTTDGNQGLCDFLTPMKLELLNHGQTCICLTQSTSNQVIKCNYKQACSHTITTSGDIFQQRLEQLRQHQFPLIYPTGIIYEDAKWLVYSQPKCQVMLQSDLTWCIIYDWFQMVLKMHQSGLRLADIYFKNFGFCVDDKNVKRLGLFDFHEIEDYQTSRAYFMTHNLYSNLVAFGKQINWHQRDDYGPRCHLPEDSKQPDPYGIPLVFQTALRSILAKSDETPQHIASVLDYIRTQLTFKTTMLEYAKIGNTSNDSNTNILTMSGVDEEFIQKCFDYLTQNQKIRSIKQYGGWGEYAMKLAQLLPKRQLSASSVNAEVLTSLGLPNFNDSGQQIDAIIYCGLSFDLRTASFGQLLKSLGSATVPTLGSATVPTLGSATVPTRIMICLTLIGNQRLSKVMKSASTTELTNFQCLASIPTVRNYLSQHGFRIVQLCRLSSDHYFMVLKHKLY